MIERVQVDPAELGPRIKHAREKARLSLLQVESKTGVDHSQQSRIERGEFKRYAQNVQKICKFFNLQPVPEELDTLRARLDRAVLRTTTRKALEAVLDAIDVSHAVHREAGD